MTTLNKPESLHIEDLTVLLLAVGQVLSTLIIFYHSDLFAMFTSMMQADPFVISTRIHSWTELMLPLLHGCLAACVLLVGPWLWFTRETHKTRFNHQWLSRLLIDASYALALVATYRLLIADTLNLSLSVVTTLWASAALLIFAFLGYCEMRRQQHISSTVLFVMLVTQATLLLMLLR